MPSAFLIASASFPQEAIMGETYAWHLGHSSAPAWFPQPLLHMRVVWASCGVMISGLKRCCSTDVHSTLGSA